MFDFIYAEESILDHPRTRALLDRFPRAQLVPCARYGEVFNRTAQNFRLQKRRPCTHPRPQSRTTRPPCTRRLRHWRRAQLLFLAPAQLPLRLPLLLPPRPVPLGAPSSLCQLRRLPAGHRRTHRRGRTRCALFLLRLRLRQPRARGHYPLYSRLPPLLCRPPAGVL